MGRTIKQLRVKVGNYPRSKNIMAEEKNIMTGGGELIANCDQLSSVENRILTIRGVQVILDRDLADLYGVETKVLNQSVKRNIERFPEHFRFQLSKYEMDELVTNCDRFKNLKHSTVCPFAFTEQGVAMLASVLRSETAIRVSIRIMNAFVSMRHFLINNDRTKILRQKCSMALSASQRLRGSWLCLHAQCRAEKHFQSCR